MLLIRILEYIIARFCYIATHQTLWLFHRKTIGCRRRYNCPIFHSFWSPPAGL